MPHAHNIRTKQRGTPRRAANQQRLSLRPCVSLLVQLGPSQQGKQAAREGAETMLAKLGKPVDLALIHWPGECASSFVPCDASALKQ